MSEENQFKLEGDKFIRLSDNKVIATLVDGKLEGVHHTQEHFRPALMALIPSEEGDEDETQKEESDPPLSKERDPKVEEVAGALYDCYCDAVGGVAFNGDALPNWAEFSQDEEKQKQADAWREVAALSLLLTPQEVEEELLDPDETPRDLFKKTLGDLSPEVISWRRNNWPEDRFTKTYKGRI